ncbi:MAG: fluoride efflux transporter CrcB [Anaerolineae bacterium]|nr:fluoride efflux transporter CrcB [Anaerolineae bacterium]
MEKYVFISLGAIVGANGRYLVQTWLADRMGTAFPWGTFVVNLTGAFILAFFLTIATERLVLDPNYRFLIAVGFCGSYTTFSSLTYESFTLWAQAGWASALINLVGSMALGMLATVAGVVGARLIFG